jgi:PilZ domain-containing protein
VTRLTKTAAVAQLTAYPTIAALDEHGEHFELHPQAAAGTLLRARTERLRLVSAATAIVRVHDGQGRPWQLTLRVESAEMDGNDAAQTTFRAVGLRLDPGGRKSERVPIMGQAWLTAINCQNVVDDEVVEARILDVAEGGIAVASPRLLRPGDLLSLRARFFATWFTAEVRVVHVRERLTDVEAGCRFVGITARQRAALRELMAYREPERGTGAHSLLRDFDWEPGQDGASLWRRLLRKAA